jgi:hypothetical protein
MHRRANGSEFHPWRGPEGMDEDLQEVQGVLDGLTQDVLELALDLDIWSGGDEDHNHGEGYRMVQNVRTKLGLPNYFGEWLVVQHDREDPIGVVARFLKEHADADTLLRGGGMFPDVSHVREFLLEHGRFGWVDKVLPAAQEEYDHLHVRKLQSLCDAYDAQMDATESQLHEG